MKIISKTIAVFVLLGLAATSPVLAESKEEKNVNSPAQTEQDDQQEFYDYHSGITYTYSVFDLVFPHTDKALIEKEKKGQ
jgi:hypothetical protein